MPIITRNHYRIPLWLDVSGIKEGWLFRRIFGRRVGFGYLHPLTINRIIKQIAEDAGLEKSTVGQLSGHSMRVGAAQDMMASGIGILPVMQAGCVYRKPYPIVWLRESTALVRKQFRQCEAR